MYKKYIQIFYIIFFIIVLLSLKIYPLVFKNVTGINHMYLMFFFISLFSMVLYGFGIGFKNKYLDSIFAIFSFFVRIIFYKLILLTDFLPLIFIPSHFS
jgi:hypothetical protein